MPKYIATKITLKNYNGVEHTAYLVNQQAFYPKSKHSKVPLVDENFKKHYKKSKTIKRGSYTPLYNLALLLSNNGKYKEIARVVKVGNLMYLSNKGNLYVTDNKYLIKQEL